MIENSSQLVSAENKMIDFAGDILDQYEHRFAGGTAENHMAFNGMIGGFLREMGIIHTDIQEYLEKVEKSY